MIIPSSETAPFDYGCNLIILSLQIASFHYILLRILSCWCKSLRAFFFFHILDGGMFLWLLSMSHPAHNDLSFHKQIIIIKKRLCAKQHSIGTIAPVCSPEFLDCLFCPELLKPYGECRCIWTGLWPHPERLAAPDMLFFLMLCISLCQLQVVPHKRCL